MEEMSCVRNQRNGRDQGIVSQRSYVRYLNSQSDEVIVKSNQVHMPKNASSE